MKTPADAPAKPPLPWKRIILLCSMWAGLVMTENISNQLLPLTLKRFTADAFVIGLVLALNPLFGFIANPLVGILSDKIWTPIGRRAFFLVTGAPIVALCLIFVPEARVLWQLVMLVVMYQFFQDVLWGSDHPLLADLIPAPLRTFVSGAMLMSAQATSWFFSRIAMGQWLEGYGESVVYTLGAVCQVGMVALPALFLGEKKVEPKPRPPLTIGRYIKDFIGDPILRRFGALGFTQYVFQNILQGFLVLFTVETLLVSKSDFGRIWSWMPAISFFFAIPIGIVAEKFLPKQITLIGGYVTMLGCCVLGWFAEGVEDLLPVFLCFGLGQLVSGVCQKAFLTEFIPRDIIGQISGAYNICMALGRTVALAGGGFLIKLFGNDYRVIFPIGAVFGVLSIYLVWGIKDVRFAERRAAQTKPLPPPSA